MSYLKIVEQPQSRGSRFRYECEKRSMGGLYGVSTKENQRKKTYPTVELIDYDGPAFLVVSCVTKDPPYLPHPHKIIQSGGKLSDGILHCKIPAGEPRVVLKNIGIQCTRRKDIKEALTIREKIRVDPFKTGFAHKLLPDRIDLTCVRLCFQVFIEGKQPGSFNVPLRPVVSEPIYDKKQAAELSISFISHVSGSVAGGQSMCILSEKVVKDEIDVRFFDAYGWEAYVETVNPHYHKQIAIVFQSPTYIRQDLQEPVTVSVELIRTSDDQSSRPVSFQYLPLDFDEYGPVKRKRQRCNESPKALVERHIKADKERDAMLNKLGQKQYQRNEENGENQMTQPQTSNENKLEKQELINKKRLDQLQKIQQLHQNNNQDLCQQWPEPTPQIEPSQNQPQNAPIVFASQLYLQVEQGKHLHTDPLVQEQLDKIQSLHSSKCIH